MFFRSHSARRLGVRRRPLTIEVLEGRTLPAGNVTTATLGDALRLTGDAAANVIRVQQLGPDQYRITGVNGTTVDGKPEVVAKSRKDLTIDLGGGRDVAQLIAVAVARDARVANSEDVSIGLTVGRDLAITTGNGTGGAIGNSVNIGSTTVGRDLTVTTGNGTGSTVGNFVSIFSASVGRDLAVTTGDGTGGASFGFGNDIDIDSTAVGHDLTIATGDGTAEVTFNKLVVQGLSTVRTGSGDDTVQVKDSTFLGLATFDGGGGTDTFQDQGGNDFAFAPILIDFEVV